MPRTALRCSICSSRCAPRSAASSPPCGLAWSPSWLMHLSACVDTQAPGTADAGFVGSGVTMAGRAVAHGVPVLLGHLLQGLPLPLPLLQVRWLVELRAVGSRPSAWLKALPLDVMYGDV